MIRLQILNNLSRASQWVRQYYAFEGLIFGPLVEDGLATLLASNAHGWFFEIVKDEEPVGYVVLTRAFDHEIGGAYGVITDLFLLEARRGQGMGTATLELVADFAKGEGFHSLDLWVLDHNLAAKRLYERLGFAGFDDRRPLSRPL